MRVLPFRVKNIAIIGWTITFTAAVAAESRAQHFTGRDAQTPKVVATSFSIPIGTAAGAMLVPDPSLGPALGIGGKSGPTPPSCSSPNVIAATPSKASDDVDAINTILVRLEKKYGIPPGLSGAGPVPSQDWTNTIASIMANVAASQGVTLKAADAQKIIDAIGQLPSELKRFPAGTLDAGKIQSVLQTLLNGALSGLEQQAPWTNIVNGLITAFGDARQRQSLGRGESIESFINELNYGLKNVR